MSTKKLSKNVIIYGVSNVLKSLVPFIMLPILTNYISPQGYGVLSIIETIFLFVTPLVILNSDGFISVKYHQGTADQLKSYISNAILISTLATGVFTVLALIFQNPLTSTLKINAYWILIIPMLTFLKVIPTITQVIFQAKQEPINHFLLSFFQTLTDFAASYILVVVFLWGFEGRVIGTFLAFALFSLIGLIVLYRLNYLSFSFSILRMKEILNFGLPLLPHALGTTSIALADRFFISYFQTSQEVGLYATAYQVSALMILFSRSVNQGWAPMLYQNLAKKNYSLVNKIIPVLFISFCMVGIVTFFLRDFIFDLLIAPEFHGAKNYFGYLLIGFIFQSFYFLVSGFFFFYHKTKLLAITTLITAVINLVLNYFLIQYYGVYGVAYATVISSILYFALTVLLYFYRIRPIMKNIT